MTGAGLRCYEGPALDGGEMSPMDSCSNPGVADGVQRGSRLVEAAIVAISSEEPFPPFRFYVFNRLLL